MLNLVRVNQLSMVSNQKRHPCKDWFRVFNQWQADLSILSNKAILVLFSKMPKQA